LLRLLRVSLCLRIKCVSSLKRDKVTELRPIVQVAKGSLFVQIEREKIVNKFAVVRAMRRTMEG